MALSAKKVLRVFCAVYAGFRTFLILEVIHFRTLPRVVHLCRILTPDTASLFTCMLNWGINGALCVSVCGSVLRFAAGAVSATRHLSLGILPLAVATFLVWLAVLGFIIISAGLTLLFLSLFTADLGLIRDRPLSLGPVPSSV
jgi:hypothetical protein